MRCVTAARKYGPLPLHLGVSHLEYARARAAVPMRGTLPGHAPPPPVDSSRRGGKSGKVAKSRAAARGGAGGVRGKSGNGKLAEVGNSRYGQCSIIHSCWEPLGTNSTDVINASPAVSEGRDMYFRERSTDNTRERGGIFPNFSKGVSRLGKGLQSGPVLGLYHFPVIPTSYPNHRLEQF